MKMLVWKDWEPVVWFGHANSITPAVTDLRIGVGCNSSQEEAC